MTAKSNLYVRVVVVFLLGVAYSLVASSAQPPNLKSSNLPPGALLKLQHGLTQQAVEELVKTRGEHQFTAALSNVTVRCISYYRDDLYGRYDLIFTNDHLASICEPPPFEMHTVPYKGTTNLTNRRVFEDPEARMTAVIRADDMIGPRLIAALIPRTPPKQSVDPGLTAAYLLARAIGAAGSAFGVVASPAERERLYLAVIRQFDPYEIALGADQVSVENRLGKPRITEPQSLSREVRYYGSIEWGRQTSRVLVWLSVAYESGRVIRVFSRDFIDEDKIIVLEDQSRAKSGQ